MPFHDWHYCIRKAFGIHRIILYNFRIHADKITGNIMSYVNVLVVFSQLNSKRTGRVAMLRSKISKQRSRTFQIEYHRVVYLINLYQFVPEILQ
jgi:hypothetical protein